MPVNMSVPKKEVRPAVNLCNWREFLSGFAGFVAIHVYPLLNPLFMAFVAGAMMFFSVYEALPMARRYRQIRLFGLGAILSVFTCTMLVAVVP